LAIFFQFKKKSTKTTLATRGEASPRNLPKRGEAICASPRMGTFATLRPARGEGFFQNLKKKLQIFFFDLRHAPSPPL
jgi:hypothetical protein